MNILRTLAALWRGARAVPLVIYLTVLGSGAAYGAGHWVESAIAKRDARIFKAGQDDIANKSRLDSVLVAIATRSQKAAETNTDSARVVVRTVTARVDSEAIAAAVLARQLPAHLDSIPAVVALKAKIFQLETSTVALREANVTLSHTIDVERAQAALTRDMYAAQYRAERIARIAQSDTIATQRAALDKRPTWRTVAKVAVVAPAVYEGVKTLVKLVVKK